MFTINPQIPLSMSSPSRPLKRSRSQSPQVLSGAATSLINHPTLYIEDGNFIIQCASTLFCMHKSRLSKHSEVFRDLCARDYKPADKLRGLPWIEVSDSEEDMEILLEIIESNP